MSIVVFTKEKENQKHVGSFQEKKIETQPLESRCPTSPSASILAQVLSLAVNPWLKNAKGNVGTLL
jgi:hypothetical protein